MSETVSQGFCRYGHFVWINEGDEERAINLNLIEAATLRKSFNDAWTVHVTTNASGWAFRFGTESDARKFLSVVVGDVSSSVSNPLEK